ncbi:virulence factor TspB C-terminal domain-related protein [Stenotrophomonas sp. SG1]|uniref:virulence factor TspB C-terminal domain-related protein n=1 Tax=Stenotrophomonas sp. SG1 TaxID=2944932 RepID=UPI0018D2A4D7|nr:virulence factor TspB C-terminal domain-related protein [Stenotrophomonas sp. SG1]MBH1519081.1 hypothetical protein [Stenotrophomonas maltophilia]MCW8343318.1 hypothetical protein [Stenotrophomonas sp. SG1]
MAGCLRDHLCGLQLMRIGRVFCWLHSGMAVCFSRRFQLLLALTAVALVVAPSAHAKSYPSQGLASAGCNAEANAAASGDKGRKATGNVQCTHQPGRYTCTYEVKPYENSAAFFITCNNFSPYETYHDYPPEKSCSAQGEYTGQGPWSNLGGSARSGSLGCREGCDGFWNRNADSSSTWTPTGDVCPDDEKKNCEQPALANAGYYWNVALSVCEPPKPVCEGGKNPNSLGQCAPEPCPDGMAQQADGTCKKKDNECPAGQVRSPDGKCLPGDGQCASGEVRGPDGTCKKDSDGDGNPDEPGEKDTFSGGDDCSSPPACSGSPIMCGQARIQWRIDCNTRKNRNVTGGLCGAMPVCTGEKCDAMEYASLLMLWRSTCALEKMASGPSGGGDSADVKAIRDALTGAGGSVTTPADRPASDVWTPSSGQPTRPNASGYGWGRGCPQPPAIEVMGQTIAFDITPLCRWLGLGSYFVVGLAALFCLRIIASKDA